MVVVHSKGYTPQNVPKWGDCRTFKGVDLRHKPMGQGGTQDMGAPMGPLYIELVITTEHSV